MADDKSVETTEDTSVSDEVDTSTNEEALDTDVSEDDGVDIEDIELSDAEMFGDDETEESEEATEDKPASESTEEESEESSEDVNGEETEETAQSTEESEQDHTNEEDTTSEPSKEEQKRLNDEAAKRRIAEKRLREEQEARRKDQLQRYLKDAGDDENELAKRQMEVERLNMQEEKSSLLQDKLQIGVDRALADIDLFKTGSTAAKEELVKAVEEYENFYVQRDQYGNVVKVQGDVYQHLQDKADSIRRLTNVGARKQDAAKSKQKRRTLTAPVKTPKPVKEDPYLSGWDDDE